MYGLFNYFRKPGPFGARKPSINIAIPNPRNGKTHINPIASKPNAANPNLKFTPINIISDIIKRIEPNSIHDEFIFFPFFK